MPAGPAGCPPRSARPAHPGRTRRGRPGRPAGRSGPAGGRPSGPGAGSARRCGCASRRWRHSPPTSRSARPARTPSTTAAPASRPGPPGPCRRAQPDRSRCHRCRHDQLSSHTERHVHLRDPAGLFGGTPRRFQSSDVPVVHDLLCGRLALGLAPSPNRRMVWSCRCSRGPGRMFPSSRRRWRVRHPVRGTWRCGSAMSWARSMRMPGLSPCSGSGAGRGSPRAS